jgi:hypothetical protein
MAKINHDMKGQRRQVPRMRWYTFVTATPVSVNTAVIATRCRTKVPHNTTHSPSRRMQVVWTVFIDLIDVWDFRSSGVWRRVTGQSEPDVSSQPSALIFKGRNVKQERLHTAEAFLGSCQFLRYSRNPPHFVEPKFSFPCAQQLAASGKSSDPSAQFNFLRISKNNYFYLCNCMVKY